MSITYIKKTPYNIGGVAKIMYDLLESHKVIPFLMGLNKKYTHSKDQILLMDPLPSINKVHSMALKVEKQIQRM